MALYRISGEEFVQKILDGKRDFAEMGLLGSIKFDLSSHARYDELQNYFQSTDLHCQPFILNDAELEGLTAKKLYMPRLGATRINLRGACLEEAYLLEGVFNSANLEGANLTKAILAQCWATAATFTQALLEKAILKGSYFSAANLRGAVLKKAECQKTVFSGANFHDTNLEGADLTGADLRGARFTGADVNGVRFSGADLRKADLRGVKNLDKSSGIENAIFEYTLVTPAEKAVVEEALRSKVLFI